MIDRRIFLQLSGGAVAGAAGLCATLGAVRAAQPAEAAESGIGDGANGLSALLSDSRRTLGERLSLASGSRFSLLPMAGQLRGVAPGPVMPGEVVLGKEDDFAHDDVAFAVIGGNPLDNVRGSLDIETWLRGAGGQQLWDDAAARFGWKPLLVGMTGGPEAHIWSRTPLRTASDLAGLRIAVPVPFHSALRALGAHPMPHRHEDMLLAWRFGVVDAVQVPDAAASLAIATTSGQSAHWYVGGLAWHRRLVSLRIPLAQWESLTLADRAIFEAVAAETVATTRAANRARGDDLMRQIVRARDQEPAPLPPAIRAEVGAAARRDLERRAAGDPRLAALLASLTPSEARAADPHAGGSTDRLA